MDEKKFKELLFQNNKYLIQEMNARDERLEKSIDRHIKENNKYLIQEMDAREKRLEERLEERISKKIFESERRQNQKLAKLEHEYGNKISAIFDKVMSIDEKLSDTRALSIKNANKLEEYGNMLFSHNYRISKLEEKVYSK